MSPYKRKSILLPKSIEIKTKREKPRKKLFIYRIHPVYPTILAIAIVFFISAYLSQCSKLIRVQYNTHQLKIQKFEIQKENRKIALSIEKLEAPGRIEMIARKKLGMISPDKRIVISLTEPASTAELEEADNKVATVR
ncbi:MAG: cell division protein FtsL [Firmicutes bacterium]|nr:cell division protein FtsL [Bacillota bacterium]